MTSFHLHDTFKGLISKKGCSMGYWGLGFQHMNFEEDKIQSLTGFLGGGLGRWELSD